MFITLTVAFFSLIALMIIHEFGHFVIAKKFGVKVEEFGIGYPPKLFGKKFGETLYSLNLIPLGAFVRIYGEEDPNAPMDHADIGRSFANLPVWKRILVCLGGVIAFWLASIVIFTVVFMIGANVPVGDQDLGADVATSIVITDVLPGSPAGIVDLRAGDEILGFTKVADFQKTILDNKGKDVVLNILRDGQTLEKHVIPRVNYPVDQGATGIGLERIANVIKKTPWYLAPWKGLLFTGEITWLSMTGIYNVVAKLVTGGGVPDGAQLAGPIGITIFLSQAAGAGVGFFLYFIGSLSVLLALFNLLPIPALDGGKLLFLTIEWVRGRAVSQIIEQNLSIICFVILITLSLFITIKFDVPRVMDFWKAGL